MVTKKKEIITPVIEELPQEEISFNNSLDNSENEEVKIFPQGEENSDSFFKAIVKELFGLKNISLKTEYLNVTENFVGTKLDFLSKYGNMPYLEEFMQKFEIKRVSLGRKGRKEILMALERRGEQEQQEKAEKLKNALGLG